LGFFLFLGKSVDLSCESTIEFNPLQLFSTPRIGDLFLDEPFDLCCESSAFAIQTFYSDINIAVRSAARFSVSSTSIFSDGLCAPSPTAPIPSRVAVNWPVMLPSDPPPLSPSSTFKSSS